MASSSSHARGATAASARAIACAAIALWLVSIDARAAATLSAQRSGVDVRLRGISAVDDKVAWASGQQGTVLRTRDGGRHWRATPVPDAQALDFRDVEAFDANTAVLLAIGPGEASRVYRTDDGGAHWTRVLQNRDPRAFFDCMAFEGARGWLLGDPVDGRFQLYATRDAGRSWTLTGDGPEAGEGDAAFAASGTCIARARGTLVVATGGARPSLRLRRDGETAWRRVAVAIGGGIASAGVFSAAPMPRGDAFVAVGGDYRSESAASAAVIVSRGEAARLDGRPGEKTTDAIGHMVDALPDSRGYRSGVACSRAPPVCVAVGPSGVDVLRDRRWSALSERGYDAVSLKGTVGWAVGDEGRVVRIDLERSPDE